MKALDEYAAATNGKPTVEGALRTFPAFQKNQAVTSFRGSSPLTRSFGRGAVVG
jgi:hypothetical protein